MTEIEKMYENVGIKKEFEKSAECLKNPYITCNGCIFYDDKKGKCNNRKDYPPFTAEKQLEIIQLLSKIRNAIQLCYSDNQYIFVVNFETEKCQWANKYHDKIDEALADMVNVLWQSLTDQEKEEIRRILNENS